MPVSDIKFSDWMFLLSGWDGGREGIYVYNKLGRVFTVRNVKIVIVLMDINYHDNKFSWLIVQGHLSSILSQLCQSLEENRRTRNFKRTVILWRKVDIKEIFNSVSNFFPSEEINPKIIETVSKLSWNTLLLVDKI